MPPSGYAPGGGIGVSSMLGLCDARRKREDPVPMTGTGPSPEK
jgi:hypothetical protein